MVTARDLGAILLKMVEQIPDCEVEELTANCPQATWNQMFLALVGLSRGERVTLRQQRPGRYMVGPAPQRPTGGQVSPRHHV